MTTNAASWGFGLTGGVTATGGYGVVTVAPPVPGSPAIASRGFGPHTLAGGSQQTSVASGGFEFELAGGGPDNLQAGGE